MKWIRVATLSFALTTPFNCGLATQKIAQIEMGKVFMQSHNTEQDLIETVEKVVGKDGGFIETAEKAGADLTEGTLKNDTVITLTTYRTPSSGVDPRATLLGQRVVAELPVSNLSLTLSDLMYLYTPISPDEVKKGDKVLASIGVRTPDGKEIVTIRNYRRDAAYPVEGEIVSAVFEEYGNPETLTVSLEILNVNNIF